MKKITFIIIAIVFTMISFTSCQNSVSQPEQANDNSIFLENYDGAGSDVTIHEITGPETRSSINGQRLCLIFNHGRTEIYSELNITELQPGITYSTHYDESGRVIASFRTEYGKVVDVDVPDNGDMVTNGAFKDWWECIKIQYNKMMEAIENDEDASRIAEFNNSMEPLITEAAAAIAASTWCLDSDNRDLVLK